MTMNKLCIPWGAWKDVSVTWSEQERATIVQRYTTHNDSPCLGTQSILRLAPSRIRTSMSLVRVRRQSGDIGPADARSRMSQNDPLRVAPVLLKNAARTVGHVHLLVPPFVVVRISSKKPPTLLIRITHNVIVWTRDTCRTRVRKMDRPRIIRGWVGQYCLAELKKNQTMSWGMG